MKTVYLALPVLVLFSAVRTSADEQFITPRLEHDWRIESPQIQKDVDYANLLLGICDNAAFQRSHLVQEYLARWDHRVVLHYLPKYAPAAG